MKKKQNIDGGKINIGKTLNKKVFHKIDKSIINPIDKQVLPKLANVGAKLGQITNKEILPTVTTLGIPVLSSVAGLAGEYLGGPIGAELTSSLTENLAKNYIPKQYQSKNKYVNALSGLVNTGFNSAISGDLDINSLYGNMGDMLDLIPDGESHNDTKQYMRNIIKQYQPQDNYVYDSDNNENIKMINNDVSNYNTELNSQHTGSINGLMGEGLKKKRKPRKYNKKPINVVIKKELPYMQYQHSNNAALNQLLHNKSLKNEQKYNEELLNMIKSINNKI